MLRFEGLSKAFGGKIILNTTTYHFPTGERCALVGANGAGKTTLLRILAGEDTPDTGTVDLPKGATMAYLPQIPNPTPCETVAEECLVGGHGQIQRLVREHRQALLALSDNPSHETQRRFDEVDFRFNNAGGYALESIAKGILAGLGFRETQLTMHPSELSGGWRMRIELAKILLVPADFMILDEPTNHLDLPSLTWVEKFLRQYRGTLLFVSHDRSLLERLPSRVLYLHHGDMTEYKGVFSDFLEEKERREATTLAAAATLKRRREHLEEFVERFGAKATKARQAQSRVKMIARIRDMEEDVVVDDDPLSMVMTLPEAPASGRLMLQARNLTIGYDHPLVEGINLQVERGQKIAVLGLNGIGKSTLVKTLCGALPALGGSIERGHNLVARVFFQDQRDVLNEKHTVLESLMEIAPLFTNTEARRLLGHFLFSGDGVHSSVKVLSGGEKSRVALARLLAHPANLLYLDEPTNHLDISSVEVLADSLSRFTGSIVFVSHDRSFIDAVATHIFAMLPDGRSALFEGGLDDYSRLTATAGLPNVLDTQPAANESKAANSAHAVGAGTVTGLSDSEVTQLRRERTLLEKQVSKLDGAMTKLKATIESFDAKLAVGGLTFLECSNLGRDQAEVRLTLERAEEDWLVGSSRIEEISKRLKSIGRL